MTKQILSNSTEDFILKYRSAVKAKLTKEQFAEYIGMRPKSVLRRKQKIQKSIGLRLPFLVSNHTLPLTQTVIQTYEDILNNMGGNYAKAERVNNLVENLKVSIKKNFRYVITSAQNATPIDESFLKSLKNYCAYNDAQLIVIPYRYKNPTSVFTDSSQDWWHNSLVEYLVDEEMKVGKHVRIMGNIKIQPTASSPLSGFDSVSGLDSAIFGHPNVELKMVASVPGKMPKMLVTTGAITIPNYTDSKAGHKASYHHVQGATILEIDEQEAFYIRQVTADVNGNFYDLNKHYTPHGVEDSNSVLALIAGDIHAEAVDQQAVDALFLNDDSLANVTNPKSMIFHDILDFQVRSHHTIQQVISRYVKHIHKTNDNVEHALQMVADFVTTVNRPGATNYVVASNHNEHISRWLAEANPNVDPENAKFFHYLKYAQYQYAHDQRTFDPIKFWCEHPDDLDGMDKDILDNTVFLTRKDNLELEGFELSLHGDIGPNGSRGSLRNLSKLGQKVIVGHSHSPGRINGSLQVGTSSKLDLGYNIGASSWLHSSAIIYNDGSATLVNIIDGKWKI